jgi:hypothetical protein
MAVVSEPALLFTVTRAVPSARARTRPELVTETTDASLELHRTTRAREIDRFGVSVTVSPIAIRRPPVDVTTTAGDT